MYLSLPGKDDKKEKSYKNLIPYVHLSHDILLLLILNNRKSKYLQTRSLIPSF